jgi:hypothetical protein
MEKPMSPRERLAWIAVLTTLVVWGFYFGAFWLDLAAARLDGSVLFWRFIICMGISLVVMIGLSVATGVLSPRNVDTPPDEMERQIEGRADRIGFRILELTLWIPLVWVLFSTKSIAAAFPADPAGAAATILANAVIMVIVLTEIIRETVHIVSFRMAA